MQAWNNKIGHTRGYCKEMSQCYAFSYEKYPESCKDKSEQRKVTIYDGNLHRILRHALSQNLQKNSTEFLKSTYSAFSSAE